MPAWKPIGWAGLAVALGALAALWMTPLEDVATGPLPKPAAVRPPAEEGPAAALARLSESLDDPKRLPELVRAVGVRGFARAVPRLVEIHRKQQDAALRADVLRSLELIATEEAVEALASIYGDDAAFRDQAAVRLSRISARESAPALVQVIEKENRRGALAAAALRALGRTRLREHVPLIADIAREGATDDVRMASAWALGMIADPRAVDVLGEVLQKSSRSLRRAAIRALGNIRSDRSLEILEAFLASNPRGPEGELAAEAIAAQRGLESSPPR